MIEIICIADNKEIKISCEEGKNLLEVLKENDIHLSAPCGGKGRCGRCLVSYNGREVLACRTLADKGGHLEIPSDNFDLSESDKSINRADVSHRTGIAVDIGSTTIALELLDLDARKVIAEKTTTNHQRIFGADVISRIDTAVMGHALELKNTVQKDICSAIEALCDAAGITVDDVDEIALAANTTMLHLLQGMNVSGLASYPFEPESLEYREADAAEVLGSGFKGNARCRIVPGISAFVGADIAAGIYALGIMDEKQCTAMIDFGTNGEMVLKKGNTIYAASTAAGPAFEGGNISCGMGSVDGAVYGFSFDGGIKTIGGSEPIGICGTGLIELIAELRRHGKIDENGVLTDEYHDTGFVVADGKRKVKLTQKDIHEFLLAKSAVRAGFDTLLEEAGIDDESDMLLYLSGGFGSHLNIKEAAYIGLVDERFTENAVAAGNTSLMGAARLLMEGDEGVDTLKNIVESTKILELANLEGFNIKYINGMRL